jgi:AcrR family transcriptional regulator
MASPRIDRRERMALHTRADILQTARRLFAERGYAATSVNDIAEEAGVAVQTIYARLGSKRGMLMALVDLVDEEAGVPGRAAEIATASTPEDVLRAWAQLHRALHERCGDIIGALITAAAVEPEVAQAVAEGSRRRRDALASRSTGSPNSAGCVTKSRHTTRPRSSAPQEPTRPGTSSSTPTTSPGTKPSRHSTTP